MADTDDSLSGTEYFDLLDGAGSNDTIEGGGSLDILLGGSGNDSISGGDAVGRDRHGRWGRGARSLAAHARRAAVGLASALGVLFVAPLLPGAGGTAHAQATEVSLSVSPDEVGESAGATTLTVVGTLHGGTLAENTEVALTVSAGTAAETDDYTAGTATLTIPVDQTAGTATLTLTPVDDDIDEDDETVTVEGTVTGLTVTPDTVTITDNDSAGVTVSHRALGVYPFARAHYTVVLDSQPSGSVSVSVEGGSSDVRVINSTLTFNERTWSTPQTVSVYAALGTDPERLEFINPHTLTHAVTGYGSVTEAADVTVTVGWEYDDDRPGVSVSPWTIDIRAPEGGAADSYTVVLDTEPSGTVTVTVHGAGDDLTVHPSKLTFDGTNWATAQTVTVEAVDDAIAEGQERIRLTHTVAGYSDEFYGDVTRAKRSVRVKVVDNDTAGVTVSPTSISAAEGGAAGSYTVVLDTEPSGTVTVTVHGAGDDLTVRPSTLTFDGTNWATARTVTVEAVDDALTEGEEGVTLTHTARDGGYDGVRIAALAVTVVDNDAAGVTVGPTSISSTEGGAAGRYTVVLDTEPSGTVTVTVHGAGDDLTVNPPTLTFDGTTWATARTVTVTAVDDALAEGQEEVTLTHTVADYGDVTEAADVTVTVVDNDAAGVTVSPTSISSTEGGAAGSYTVVLDTEPSGTVTVTMGGAGDDLTVHPSTLTFDGTTWATARTVTVTAVDDAIAEGQEEVTLTHTVAGYGDVTEAADVTVTVVDNDTAGVTVSHSVLTVAVFGRVHYTVVLDSQPSGTVPVSVEGGSADVDVSPSTLTFNERTWSTPQTVTVFAALESDPVSLEYVPPHTLTHTVTGYGSVTEGPDVTVTVVERPAVVDNDAAGVTVSPTSISAAEGGAAGSYTVVLDTEPSGTVTVTVHGAGDDLTVNPPTLTFDGTTWATARTVTVEAVDDALAEGQEEVALTHTVADYGGVTEAADVTVTVVDNDAAGVTVGPTSISAAEGGAAGSYTVVLDTEPSGTVTVTVHGAGDDLTVSPPTLTFDGTTWATARTVTVEAVDDALAEGQEEVALTHTVADYGGVTEADDVTVIVVDNDPRTPPALLGTTLRGDRLTLTYDQTLDEDTVPAPEDFVVNAGSPSANGASAARSAGVVALPESAQRVDVTDVDVTDVEIAGATVTLTLASEVPSGEQLTVSYTPGADPIRGVTGVEAPEISALAVTARPSTPGTLHIVHFESAANRMREGFVRVINRSDEAGEVRIVAIDEAGTRAPRGDAAGGRRCRRALQLAGPRTGQCGQGPRGARHRRAGARRLAPGARERPRHRGARLRAHRRRVRDVTARHGACRGRGAPGGVLQPRQQPRTTEPTAPGEPVRGRGGCRDRRH